MRRLHEAHARCGTCAAMGLRNDTCMSAEPASKKANRHRGVHARMVARTHVYLVTCTHTRTRTRCTYERSSKHTFHIRNSCNQNNSFRSVVNAIAEHFRFSHSPLIFCHVACSTSRKTLYHLLSDCFPSAHPPFARCLLSSVLCLLCLTHVGLSVPSHCRCRACLPSRPLPAESLLPLPYRNLSPSCPPCPFRCAWPGSTRHRG